MRINTKLKIAVLVPLLIAVTVGIDIYLSYTTLHAARERAKTVQSAIDGMSELNNLSGEYIIYHSGRSRQQFMAEHEAVTRLLSSLQLRDSDQQRLIRAIRANVESIDDVFNQAVSNFELLRSRKNDVVLIEAQDRLEGQLLVRSRQAMADGLRLERILDHEIASTERTTSEAVFVLILVVTAPLTLMLLRMMRTVTASLDKLKSGTEVIATGNLEHRIDLPSRDELGDLSRAFDHMTGQLKTTTVSRDALSQEVEERKQVEEEIKQQNAILQAINTIFDKALSYQTEEELAAECLSVAEELTQSRYGFIGEINAEGTLSDLAISDMGWSVCAMYDQAGHRRSPGNFPIQGIYGRALVDGKGFYTNDPTTHPDFIGLPDGHPPLSCFLGVPFMWDERVQGMIAVANRPDGYTERDLHALEALAPVIMEVLHRKKAEKALLGSEERLNRAQELAHLGSWELDLLNNRLTWSDEAYRIFGLQPQEFGATYEAFLEAVHPDDRAAVDDAYSGSIREGKSIYEIEHRVVRKSTGEVRWVRERCEHAMDGSGRIVRSTGMVLDITTRRQAEQALEESEKQVRTKLESILSPGGDVGNLELSDIIDAPAIQVLMNNFYQLAPIPMSIIDLKGNLLVGVGWSEICTKFHRVHPSACAHCLESDLQLSAGIPPGESRLYKCRNNMWDIASPIMVGGQHVGNLFSGQFFFDDEPIDYELFRAQAKEYGFDEKAYLVALEAVPRFSRKTIETGMAFFMKLADMISLLSYSNIKLARSLAEGETLIQKLQESQDETERQRTLLETVVRQMPIGLLVLDREGQVIVRNEEAEQISRESQYRSFFEKYQGASKYRRPDGTFFEIDELSAVRALRKGEIIVAEPVIFDTPEGEERWLLVNSAPLRNTAGQITGSVSVYWDVTDQKKAERERERLLAEVSRQQALLQAVIEQAPIGIIIVDAETQKIAYASPATESITGRFIKPGESLDRFANLPRLNTAGNRYLPEEIPLMRALHEGATTIGEEIAFLDVGDDFRIALVSAAPVVTTDGRTIAVITIFHDITDRKKLEEEQELTLEELRVAHDDLAQQSQETEAQRTLLQAILSQLPVGVDVIDAESKQILISNEQVAKILHLPCPLSNVDDIVTAFQPLHLDGSPYSQDEYPIARTLHTGELILDEEFPALCKNGETHVFSVSTVPMRDREGKTIAVIRVLQDVTERRRIEEKLLKAERARAELAEALNAEINHRMKNNLLMVAAMMQLQISRMDKDGEAIKALQDAGARIAALSAVHEQMYKAHLDKVDLQHVIQRVVELAQDAFSHPDVEMTFSGIPLEAHARGPAPLESVACRSRPALRI